MVENSTAYVLVKVSPIWLAIDLTAPSLEPGSFIKLDIASKGKRFLMVCAVSQETNFQPKMPKITHSVIYQTSIAPTAKADLLTSMPRNKPKEKYAINFIKKAKIYVKSEVIIANSL